MEHMITAEQLRKMKKILRKTNKTFKDVATEAGITDITCEASELSKEEAKKILRHFSMWLISK